MKQIKHLSLITQLTITSFKLRNEGSYLGILWYLLNPLLLFLILYFVFSNRLGSGIEHFALYLLLGIIQFNFLNLAAGTSMKNIIQNSNLIKSLSFSRESLIISSVLMALISHLFELAVFILFSLFLGIKPVLIIVFPLILLLQFLFTLGLCLTLSSVIIYFRDLENIWLFVSRLWWFLTPVFYSVKEGSLIHLINIFNPMYYIITISRNILIYSRLPDLSSITIIACISIISFITGYLIFTKLKVKFAELV
ncbi:ABC transporter permease [Candidatus Woesearchaeota archaeon]|nr:ABC transporter permease [Candidatus Woesearchaeota archaeon]